MKPYSTFIFSTLVATLLLLISGERSYAIPLNTNYYFQDTTKHPLTDRRGDPYTYPGRNAFELRDTAFIKRTVEYDPETKQYFVIEKIGERYYRTPMTFSMREFIELQGKKDENEYFRTRANTLINLNRRNVRPNFGFSSDWMNRITGNGKVEINPTGYVDIAAGYQGQHINNPTLPERARKTGGFDFNMNAQLQVDANIGDKIKLPINYNTLANFDFENQLKLDYHGKDDEILKQFQLGNINFTSKGSLIPGAQSLFGVKTQLQFGKLFVTTVLANQRSQRQAMGMQGGAASQLFDIRADEYEENRHFLLAHYFRNNYNNAMKDLPLVRSNVQIVRMEVWVTNRTGITTDTRDIVAFMDLGEGNPFSVPGGGNPNTLPGNDANSLYGMLLNTPNARNSTTAQTTLIGMGLQPVQDFEKTFARKLFPSDYYFNERIGFLSINQPLQPDEVLGVSYQYTYNGKVYQVGEFSQDVPPDSSGNSQKVLFLKLLKATSQRTNLPIWDLMMKNVYSIGYGQLEPTDFKLDVVYEEPSLGVKRYLPINDSVLTQYRGLPLLTLVNLDRLNNNNDPQPDGVFDYIPNYTVIPSQSRIIFPVLEPFGRDLEYVYANDAAKQKYLYYPLYDTIKAIAQTYANLNRFKLVGRSQSQGSGEYQLGFNIPRGSVTVSAGGQILQENIDYEINYDLGSLRIINSAIINSGVPVNVQYENNATFGLQQKNYLGLRLDYLHSKNLSLGASMVRLGERPFFNKQTYGEDPIRNTMYGVDFDYRNDIPRLSKWLDKLPFYSTRTVSSINAYGEAAMLQPGHSPQIGKGSAGVIYIDDFEGTRSSIDLRFPLISWTLASTPQKSPDKNGTIMFPEAELSNNLEYGYNRAKLAWYNIEPVLQERRNPNNPLRGNLAELSKPETRQVFQNEIFPQRTLDIGQALLTTFDMAYYPSEKGPYNFASDPAKIDFRNNLRQPKKAWGGIMRNIDQTDFETSNIEFIEFWIQDPFINKPNSNGGEIYFNLGTISEDILRDGKRQFENGLPTPSTPNTLTDETVWGRVPRNPIQVTNAFSNDPADRLFQDVGFDGLTDDDEKVKFESYLNTVQSILDPVTYQQLLQDPAKDNFKGYRDPAYEKNPDAGILQRYKHVNNPHGNSPIANSTDQFTNAFTLYPDQEELNRDNTLNETEEYFQYRVELRPGMNVSNNPLITDVREARNVRLADGTTRSEKWYLFRIPIKDYEAKVGNIPDFKSVRFIRMFLTSFEDSIVLRFAKLELVRNQWRKFNFETDTTGNYLQLPANDPTQVDVLAVNLEENDQRNPIPYVTPPGIDRQQQISNNNVQLLQNEQALSLRVCNLEKSQARGVFKTMNLDLRQYGRMEMFIHAESAQDPTSIRDRDLNAIIRIGNDFVSNYYEIRIPLIVTPWGTRDSALIWPSQNSLDFNLNELTILKAQRNSSGFNTSQYYKRTLPDGRVLAIMGNPNLGEVRGMMLAVENAGPDVGCAEIWFNELRLSQLDERGGWAALGRVDIRLADLGNLTFAGSARSRGFGTLEQRVNERSREDFKQFDVSTNLDLGKLVPKGAALQIPVYAGISKTQSTPEYDPYDLDIRFQDKLKNSPDDMKDSIRRDAIDDLTIKTVSFNNVKKIKTNNKPVQPWDISNLDFNYSYSHQERSNPIIESEDIQRTRGAVSYNFMPQQKFMEPFKPLIKSNSQWLALIRDINFNYKPQISVKADVFRQMGSLRSRNVGGGGYKLPETFDKYFYFDRYYTLRWDLTRSLTLDFNAINNARVDEPFGYIDTKGKKDSVSKNFWKGGRTTHYQHNGTLSYTLPTSKIPFLDWTNIRASYTGKYDWIAASLLAKNLGNTILNGQTKNINGEFNFDQLYNKWKFLRGVYSDRPAQPKPPVVKDTATGKQQRKRDPNALPEVGGLARFIAQMATSVKRVGVQYTEDLGTLLPGYLDSTKFLGMNFRNSSPGWKYVMGYQPDTSDINSLGARGLITRDEIFNELIRQTFSQRLSLTAQLTPIRDLNVDVNLDKTFRKDYAELFKDTTGFSGLTRLNPYAMGSFSISYISYQTLFSKFDPNEVSETFKQFEANRATLSQRLKGENVYAQNNPVGPDGYVQGYGRYAQDVLIPAFLAAYTDKDPNSISLIKSDNPNLRSNPFSGLLPKPNWNITYNGLSRLKPFEKIFTNFTIRHGYNSTLSMNSFNTALLFQDPFRVGYPFFRDTLTGNYIPYFLVPNITISEQFSPLLEVDMTFTNQLSTRVEYRKSRQLSLSLVDYQLAENRSTEYTIGFNWRRRGVPFLQNMRIGKEGKRLDNDITFRFDFSLRDDATANSKLDQNTAFGTAGQKVIRLSPTIDYVLNNRINLKFYFEQNRVIPKIATAAPVTTTRGGLQVRISLVQ